MSHNEADYPIGGRQENHKVHNSRYTVGDDVPYRRQQTIQQEHRRENGEYQNYEPQREASYNAHISLRDNRNSSNDEDCRIVQGSESISLGTSDKSQRLPSPRDTSRVRPSPVRTHNLDRGHQSDRAAMKPGFAKSRASSRHDSGTEGYSATIESESQEENALNVRRMPFWGRRRTSTISKSLSRRSSPRRNKRRSSRSTSRVSSYRANSN